MLFLYKGSGDHSSYAAFRPVTVNPVPYRLFAQVLRRRTQAWAEREKVLGELQHASCQGRRLEDNLFIRTQFIELATGPGGELWAAFLDVEKAYDCVEHEVLWNRLRLQELPEEVVARLRALYTDMKVVVEWQGLRSRPIEVQRGLRQGCPLSPLLFMLLLSDLEGELERCGLRFDLTYMDDGRVV
ncbi:hypothetical protein V5799_016520 [Amblyomma americanum]|uniref:Reverse transcriptase domain-containing protein n=1 Tax=Amblyomma americanum TaxID=6943 RepID=A0AAQ4F4W8_AMBAM